MNRRAFLTLAGLTGAAALIPSAASDVRAGAAGGHDGPYWITLQAGWGWDPSLFCDPKGEPVNLGYLPSAIKVSGALRYAPYPHNEQFFSKYGSELCVINGIDLAVHEGLAADRHLWTGSLAKGYPSLPALIAAGLGKGLPMPFLSTGGFEETAGVVARSCLSGAGPFDWQNLRSAGPNADPIFSDMTEARITQYTRERLKARRALALPPPIERALAAAEAAEMSRTDVELWMQAWPTALAEDPDRLVMQLAVAAFKAKVAVSANFHGALLSTNTDEEQIESFVDWMTKFDMLMEEIEAQGLKGSVIVMASSGGGRTPMYLDEGEKGRWSVGSAILMGPGIPKNRVIGATDEGLRPLALDPKTLAPKEGGVRLRPAHIHRALRELAGISGSEVAEGFPLQAEDLPLFS